MALVHKTHLPRGIPTHTVRIVAHSNEQRAQENRIVETVALLIVHNVSRGNQLLRLKKKTSAELKKFMRTKRFTTHYSNAKRFFAVFFRSTTSYVLNTNFN